MRRYAIIIGAMKSGTTTLFDALARHPAIAPARNKEPGFFAFDGVYAQDWDWYDGLFEFDPDQHMYRLEASTDYTKAPFVTGVWDRMTADPSVEVKLIYIMRHPLRRIESHARHVQGPRKEIGQRISPIADHSLDQGFSPVNVAVSMYAQQLDAYAEAWTSGRLHCLTLEGLRADPASELSRIFRFLDLEPGGAPTDLPRSNAAEDKTRVHPSWRHLSRVGPLMAVGRAMLPETLRTRIRSGFRQKVVTQGRFRLIPEEETFLARLLADDLKRLSEVYHVDTSVWRMDGG